MNKPRFWDCDLYRQSVYRNLRKERSSRGLRFSRNPIGRKACSHSNETNGALVYDGPLTPRKIGYTEMCTCTDEVATGLSLYEEAVREADRHKWIESQKHGRDLGPQAVRDWFRNYWRSYCRCKQMEHLEGCRQWREFGDLGFGRFDLARDSSDVLLDRVLDRVRVGYENLEMITWAQEWGLPVERVLEILAIVDVNRARLEPLI